MHVLTLWIAIPDAMLYMDKCFHNLKSGLPGVKGFIDIRSLCGQCTQVHNPMPHGEPFNLTTLLGWPMVTCTTNRVFWSGIETKKGVIDINLRGNKKPVALDAEFRQPASEAGLHCRHSSPMRKCRVALKGTLYKEPESAGYSDQGSSEDVPSMPSQRIRFTTRLATTSSSSSITSSNSSSTSTSSNSSGTSSDAMTTGDGEEGATVNNVDAASRCDTSPADWQQQHVCVCFVLCGCRAAVRTLPLRCVVPMATHTQADGTLMIGSGGATSRITPGPPTQPFGCARLSFSSFLIFLTCWFFHTFSFLPAVFVGATFKMTPH